MQQKPIIVQFIWTYFRLFKCKAVLTTNYYEYCVSCTVCCSTKWCNLNERTLASFSFILGLFKQTIIFLQQINVKNVMSIQYMALGFKSTTSWTWVISHLGCRNIFEDLSVPGLITIYFVFSSNNLLLLIILQTRVEQIWCHLISGHISACHPTGPGSKPN